MMKDFKKYLAESTQDHTFVIKFAEKPTDDQVSIIEMWLKRYDLKDMTSPQLIETDHTDFVDVPNRKVFELRVTLGMPISAYVLLQDLKTAANISEKLITVRTAEDPLTVQSMHDTWSRMVDADEKENGSEPAARLSTDRFYFDAEQPATDPLFGNEYNNRLLTYLAGVADTRPSMKVDAPSPLFSWLQMEDVQPGEPHQDTSDFNAHIDTPKPASIGDKTPPASKKNLTTHGTMSNSTVPTVKLFKDSQNGKAKQIVQPAGKE